MWFQELRVENSRLIFRYDESYYEESFYRAVKPALKVAKLFGLFPININSKNPQEIYFKWVSLRTFFSLIFVIGTSLTSLMILKLQVSLGPLTARNIVGIVFFSSCAIICILLFMVSQNFKELMVRWASVELNLLSIDYRLPTKCWPLRKRLLTITIVYLTLSTLEHLLYVAVEIHKEFYDIDVCKPKDFDPLKVYMVKEYAFIITNLPFNYNNFVGFLLAYLNFSYTFFWNFLDLFIILISIGIAFLYEKINIRVGNFKGLIVNEKVWAEIRFHYIQISELLQYTNKSLGVLLIFSCFVDGYFMLVQLLNITTSLPFLINKIYFWYSLIFIAMRTTATALAAGRVQRNARYPMVAFRTIPTEGWNEEIQRFFNQIKSEKCALSGMEFFFLNKRLLFGLLSALITYELVLLQFNASDIDWKSLEDCKIFEV